jgi:hypothetical protein
MRFNIWPELAVIVVAILIFGSCAWTTGLIR